VPDDLIRRELPSSIQEIGIMLKTQFNRRQLLRVAGGAAAIGAMSGLPGVAQAAPVTLDQIK
jgi:hypothetical protein